MSLIRSVTVTLLLAGLLAACSKSPSGDAATPVTSVEAVTGIPECDSFLNAYEHCLADKIPAEAGAQMKSGIEQWKNAWKTMASNDATRAGLPQACQQARDASAPALKAYGCTL